MLLDQPTGQRRRQQGVTGRHDGDAVDQPVRRGALQQEPGRARAQRAVHVLVQVVGGQDEDAGRRAAPATTSRVAAMPSRTGMRMSMRTTSGAVRRVSLHRLAAVGGLPHDVEPPRFEDQPQPGADQLLVVGDQHRRHAGTSTSGRVDVQDVAVAVAPVLQRAAEHRDPLRHADQPQAAAARPAEDPPGWSPGSRPAPAAREIRTTLRPLPCRSALVRASCTIRYAERSTRAAGRRARPGSPASTASPRPRNPSRSSGSRSRPASGAQTQLVVGVPDQVQQPPVSDSACRPTAATSCEQPLGAAGVRAHQALRRGHLQHHRAHRVRQDVVQLAGDARPLRRRRLLAHPVVGGGEPLGLRRQPPVRSAHCRTSTPTTYAGTTRVETQTMSPAGAPEPARRMSATR